MRVRVEVIALENQGDEVLVRGQGSASRGASWRPMQRWQFTVPDYVAKHYRLGQQLTITVTPKAKP